jgi:hypothetical protein
MAVVNAAQANKTVADPIAEYESLKPLWQKSRAVCSGERFVKDYDSYVDVVGFRNLLIPFSPSMTQKQYDFYRAEAELPGIVSQFAKMLVGGLLRKQPTLSLPDGLPREVHDWIMNQFGQDDSSMVSFLDVALWEELQTSRAWVYIDYPKIENPESISREDLLKLKPYPILWQAESVINWRTRQDSFGKSLLDRVIVRSYEEFFDKNEFHPTYRDTVKVHELDENGFYQIRIFQQTSDASSVQVVNGQQQKNYDTKKPVFELINTITDILSNGERLQIIPAWPLNGNTSVVEPVLMPIIDKEINLYNKLSRRNHLLYGASTYTPIIISDMGDDDFDAVVAAGLGSWIRLRQGDDAKVLETPTAALQDMDRAIAASIEEMAKMGIRMLSPETAQSGIALEIRNAAQTAQLGALNTKISNTFKQIIAFMINWKYNLQLRAYDISFSLSADFNPTPLGADWLRLATEWYQQGLIPRSVWIMMIKQNDLVSPDYDDEEGKVEITADMEAVMKTNGSDRYAEELKLQEEK